MSSTAPVPTESDPATGPEPQRHIGNLIRRAQQAHAAAWQREVSDRVSSVQYGALAVLERRPGASQKELGDELGLDRSTIADLVRRMERGGLIGRVRADDDRRRNALELTGNGAEELVRLRPRVEHVQRLLVAALDEAEAAELRRLLALVIGSGS